MRGVFFQEGLQAGDAQGQFIVRRGGGNRVGEREIECGLGDPFGFHAGMRSQQVLPDAPCFGSIAGGQKRLAQPIAGFDDQLAGRMFDDELAKAGDRLLILPQSLIALSDLQFDLGPGFWLGARLQRLIEEFEGFGVIRGFGLVAGFEVRAGELQINVGDFLFSRDGEERDGFFPIDLLGGSEVAFAG